jgi:hypothetical protein
VNFRDIVMVAATQSGGASAGPPLGPELIINGNMSSDVGWTLGGDGNIPVIAGGKMTIGPAPDGGTALQSPTIDVATYRTSVTIDSITDGFVQLYLGNVAGTPRTAPGTFIEDIAADGVDEVVLILVTDGAIQIDDLSVKEVL